jgi:hypothetical protein
MILIIPSVSVANSLKRIGDGHTSCDTRASAARMFQTVVCARLVLRCVISMRAMRIVRARVTRGAVASLRSPWLGLICSVLCGLRLRTLSLLLEKVDMTPSPVSPTHVYKMDSYDPKTHTQLKAAKRYVSLHSRGVRTLKRCYGCFDLLSIENTPLLLPGTGSVVLRARPSHLVVDEIVVINHFWVERLCM